MGRSLETGHFELDIVDDERVVKLVRTPEPFRNVGEMIAVLEEIFRKVEAFDATAYGLLVDGTRSPQRSDDGYQKTFKSFRERLDQRFARVGVVLASDDNVRKLEERGTAGNVRVTTDPAAALAWASHGTEP